MNVLKFPAMRLLAALAFFALPAVSCAASSGPEPFSATPAANSKTFSVPYELPSGLAFKLRIALPDSFVQSAESDFSSFYSKKLRSALFVAPPKAVPAKAAFESLGKLYKNACEASGGKHRAIDASVLSPKNASQTSQDFLSVVSCAKAQAVQYRIDYVFSASNTWGQDQSCVAVSLAQDFPSSDPKALRSIFDLWKSIGMNLEY